jgi:hypothetical protein
LPYDTCGNTGDTDIYIEASNADDELFGNNTYEEEDMDDYIFIVKCVVSLFFVDISHSNTIKLNVIGRPERL